jgi:hypothetical protein
MDNKLFYVNSSAVACTLCDLHLMMKSSSPMLDEKGAAIGTEYSETIDAVMSIQHAKLLQIALETSIKKYEDVYGEVDISKLIPSQTA